MVPVKSADTIVAKATASGRGGIGIVRVSGKLCSSIASTILKKIPKPRVAEHLSFWDQNQNPIDKGIALFFKGPHSFTGEDVLELQGHGGPFVLEQILQETVRLGARLAEPGEFSLRSFLNNKMDLFQAEAIAELINASSEQAAKSAARSLQGDFSREVNKWIEALIQLRMFIEASIDFPEEDIDFLGEAKVSEKLETLMTAINKAYDAASQGALLAEGIRIAIAGKPNAGKSSFLNRLTGLDSAIVTDIPGTTRDVLKEHIAIDGIPIQLIDTAGLRNTVDVIESEGIKRACREIKEADHVFWIIDGFENEAPFSASADLFSKWISPASETKYTVIVNKIDLQKQKARIEEHEHYSCVYLSAKTGEGFDLLKDHLKKAVGFSLNGNEGVFLARTRHLEALKEAQRHLETGFNQLQKNKAAELLAEELRMAQVALEEITGRFSSDDLLGKIFSEFCIGK